jgi:hypothetical protein
LHLRDSVPPALALAWTAARELRGNNVQAASDKVASFFLAAEDMALQIMLEAAPFKELLVAEGLNLAPNLHLTWWGTQAPRIVAWNGRRPGDYSDFAVVPHAAEPYVDIIERDDDDADSAESEMATTAAGGDASLSEDDA